MRRTGTPAIAGMNDTYVELNRVTFGDTRIAEDYLQRPLYNMPGILPVEEIDSSFAPIVSLGREVKQALRRALLKYKLHTDQELFDKAYGYIRQYY